MKIVILGLSYTSSWGNGHATTYRALIRELCARGRDVLFLERDMPWYAQNRDAPTAAKPAKVELYSSLSDLRKRYTRAIKSAAAVIVGSYVPEGIEVGEWVVATAEGAVAFYDIDTPVTLAQLERGDCAYVSRELIRCYQLYLSFTGGPTLRRLEDIWGSPMARPLYCSVDVSLYSPQRVKKRWDLGYLGTYSVDRQPTLEKMLLEPARRWRTGRFSVAGALYPEKITWPENVTRTSHLPPAEHRKYYNQQRFTLNVTRADMIDAGYSPSVRLFEAAACGAAVLSDQWCGLEDFYTPGEQILTARVGADTLAALDMSDAQLRSIGRAARERTLDEHTSRHRALQLLTYLEQLQSSKLRQFEREQRNGASHEDARI